MKRTQTTWAAIVRGLLAVAVAMLTSVIASVMGHVAAGLMIMTGTLQGCIALRAFLDTSNATASAEASQQAPNDQGDQDSAPPPANITAGPTTPSWQQHSPKK